LNIHYAVLVRTTFEQIHPQKDLLAHLFYERLFELDPDARGLFRGDMIEQGHKFVLMLSLLVKELETPASLDPLLEELARQHWRYRVTERRHYRTMRQALLDVLEQLLGEAFTPEVRAAWATAYDLLEEKIWQATPPKSDVNPSG
jgi:hemoglobin-like flavoprotein